MSLSGDLRAVTRCMAADGSVSYVQGNCPDLSQKRNELRVWDSGKGMKTGPDESTSTGISSKNTASPTQRADVSGPIHPCNSSPRSPVQARLESEACAVLNGPHDADSSACNTLASGSWQHYGNMSVPEYKALITQCSATERNGSRSLVETGRSSATQPLGTRLESCFRATIVKPTPFQGNRGEIFRLDDASFWEVTDDHLNLNLYRPVVRVCEDSNTLIVDKWSVYIRKMGN